VWPRQPGRRFDRSGICQKKDVDCRIDKVIVSVVFRGRELAHVEEGHKVVKQIIQQLEDVGKVESAPSQQGRRIVCILTPK
jgi:translation initiation factor IF-3